MSKSIFWLEVPYEESKRADAILGMLPHDAIDHENLKDRVKFGVYLSAEDSANLPKETFESLAELLNAMRWEIEIVPIRDWVAETQAGLPPVKAGQFIMYGSHDKDRNVVPKGSHGLLIDAATAFGTGHHGSTKGCLVMYSKLLKRLTPKSVIDIGTGSGVLAIAAAKAQKMRIDATDFDPEAVRVTKVNCALNGVAHHTNAWVSDGYDRVVGKYDLVFANILAKPLIRLAVDAAPHVSKNGYLIMAGLQDWQKAGVINAYRLQGLVLKDQLQFGRWTTLLMQKAG